MDLAAVRSKAVASSVVVDSLFIAAPIVCWRFVFGLCFCFYAALGVLSSFAMISLKKRDRAGCFLKLSLSSCCLVAASVVCLFLTVSWVAKRMVVAFSGHTHILFII